MRVPKLSTLVAKVGESLILESQPPRGSIIAPDESAGLKGAENVHMDPDTHKRQWVRPFRIIHKSANECPQSVGIICILAVGGNIMYLDPKGRDREVKLRDSGGWGPVL